MKIVFQRHVYEGQHCEEYDNEPELNDLKKKVSDFKSKYSKEV